MKSILSIVLVILSVSVFSQNLSEIRAEFHSVVLNPDDSKEFHAFLSSVENPSTTVKAYQAVSEALLAQVLWNPFNKLKQVVKYGNQMEEAVNADPDNIEIRFLRLAIEYNLPAFLGMSSHLEEDVKLIAENLSNVSSMQVNPMFGQYIFHFLEETDLCSKAQLSQMKQTFDRSATAMAGSK
ncbi:hypothetical protein [Ekhidna sp.]|uniref:hypothetical protein n=1 Tax=Ekhidna sp. TaxID=2608089 RepID=UPI003CCC2C97